MRNKNMKFPLMGLGLIALFFISACSNNPSVELPFNGKQLLLTEFKSDDKITRFEYNADNSLHKVFFSEDPYSNNQNINYTVRYLTNKRVDELVGSNGTKIKISYGLNGITKSEVFSGNTSVSTSEYSYLNNQVYSALINTNYGYVSIGSNTHGFKFNYDISNNVRKMNYFSYKPSYYLEGIINFQFDDKQNPFAAAGDLMMIFWQYANKNNIIRQENKDMSSNLLELIETNYTYNSLGYPIKATMKITEPGMQPTTSQLSFTYK